MIDLLPVTPCAGLLPITRGTVNLREVVIDQVYTVAPFTGQKAAVSAALKDQLGLGLAKPNRILVKADVRVQWFGHGIWLVHGTVALPKLAAVTDQSDAWTRVELTGQGIEQVLTRLVPVDLRRAEFKVGHTRRSLLGHMSVAITRTAQQSIEIMAMRSMAGTLVHDLTRAMQDVAAR